MCIEVGRKEPPHLEVLAIVALPTAEERRRRGIILSRVMLLAIDRVLSARGAWVGDRPRPIPRGPACLPGVSGRMDRKRMIAKKTGSSSGALRACAVSKATMLRCETLGRNFPLKVPTFST